VMDAEAAGDRCFGIIYLMVADQEHVSLGYGYCLRSLGRLSDVVLSATWTAEDGGSPKPRRPSAPIDPRTGALLWPGPPALATAPRGDTR